MPNQRAISWAAVSSAVQADDDRESIPTQIAENEAAARRFGLDLADTLIVPGHSRRYLDFHELASDARAQGIDAFDKLLAHIRAADFDVLICRDGDRFARSQALHAYIVESVIEAGARIYSQADGWIDKTNYRMFIALGGYRSAGDIDKLVARRDMGMRGRIKRGLPAGKLLDCYVPVRDERTGELLGIQPDPAQHQLYLDLADLFLDGVTYTELGTRLYADFKYVDKQGKPFWGLTFYRFFYSPAFWGHSAYMHRANRKFGKESRWVYDETVASPPEILVQRNTHQPIYAGELGERMKAELRRREDMQGTRSPRGQFAMTGLIWCGECGHRMTVRYKRSGTHHYACNIAYSHEIRNEICHNRKLVRERDAIDLVRDALNATLDPASDMSPLLARPSAPSRLASLETERNTLKAQLDQMVAEQVTMKSPVARQAYALQIDALASRIEVVERQYFNVEAIERASRRDAEEQSKLLAWIDERGVDAVLSDEPHKANQVLRIVLAQVQIRAKNGEVYLWINDG